MDDQLELSQEWPETEERIDIIGSNGGDGTHYLDIKKQMLSQPTDREVIDWIKSLKEDATISMKKRYDGDYSLAFISNNGCIVKMSSISYLDCLKQIVGEL